MARRPYGLIPEPDNWRPAALAWLDGERTYQNAKFGERVYKEEIAKGVAESLFGQAMGSYAIHCAILQEAGGWQQMVQRAGKIAACCRGVYAALVQSHDARTGDNSLELAAALIHVPLSGRYQDPTSTRDLERTPLGMYTSVVDGALADGDTDTALSGAILMLGEGLQLFGDKISVQAAAEGRMLLPCPGESTGNLVAWTPPIYPA